MVNINPNIHQSQKAEVPVVTGRVKAETDSLPNKTGLEIYQNHTDAELCSNAQLSLN